MKQLVSFLLLLAFTAIVFYSCKDASIPTAPPQNPDFIVEMNITVHSDTVDTVTAGEEFNVEIKVQDIREEIPVENVTIALSLEEGNFANENDSTYSDNTGSDGRVIFNNLKIEKADDYISFCYC